MFYTKYRPQSFDELFGLESIAQALKSQLKKGQVGHAYLFFGPRGTGKTTTARILARELGVAGLDLIEIDAASNRGIDDVRDLREKIGLSATQSPYKVYIIDEVHMLTKEAFNALLKTLEEPPAHAVLILCTTESNKVPETIRSRCQQFAFRRATMGDLVKKLRYIAEAEKAKVLDEDLEMIARAAEGGFRDAETMLEQVVVGGVEAKDVTGVASGQSVGDFVDLLTTGDAKSALLFINKLYDEGINPQNFTTSLLEYLRSILLAKAGVSDELIESTEEMANRLITQANTFSSQNLEYVITEYTQLAESGGYAAIPQLPLELTTMKIIEYLNGSNEEGKPPSILTDSDGGEEVIIKKPSVSEKVKPNKTEAAKPLFSLNDITSQWEAALRAVKPYNHSLEALLRSARPSEVIGDELCLEVFYKFHKERLEEMRNKGVLEKVLSEIIGLPLRVRCILTEKKEGTSNFNSSAKGGNVEEAAESALEAFGGGL